MIPRGLLSAWAAVLGPGLILGTLEALKIDASVDLASLGTFDPGHLVGPLGALLSLVLWAYAPGASDGSTAGTEGGALGQVASATSFVTPWVVLGYLAFDLTSHVTDLDLAGLFDAWAPLVPLLAIAVGFLPGCGPQIIVTGLYLEGALPLSAQLGNSISNDGDALFPAIALARAEGRSPGNALQRRPRPAGGLWPICPVGMTNSSRRAQARPGHGN